MIEIRSRGGRLRAAMTVAKSGDYVQLEDATLSGDLPKPWAVPVLAGTHWRWCAELAERTGGATQYLRFDNVYDALRAGAHIDEQYGVGFKGDPASETQTISETVETARAFASFLLRTHLYDTDAQKRLLERAQAQLVAKHAAERAREKVSARDQFMRGTSSDMRDIRDRRNPLAKAMVSGGGIAHLLKRLDQIETLSAHVSRETIATFHDIERHMDLYSQLWDDLHESAHLVSRGLFQRLIDIVDNMSRSVQSTHETRRRAWSDLQKFLGEYRDAFAAVVSRPFRLNAQQAVLDIDEALECCKSGHVSSLRKCLHRLRRGSRWMFALHALQMDVIVPLSSVEHRLRLQERKRRREDPTLRSQPLIITRSMASQEVAAIEAKLVNVEKRLAKCSDVGLRIKVRKEFVANIARACVILEAGNIPNAKQALLDAAAVL